MQKNSNEYNLLPKIELNKETKFTAWNDLAMILNHKISRI